MNYLSPVFLTVFFTIAIHAFPPATIYANQDEDSLPLQPIPQSGAVPPVVNPAYIQAIEKMALSGKYGPYQRQLKNHARRFLGNRRDPELRTIGLRGLSDFTDNGALFAMPFALRRERPDVRKAILEHLASSGPVGEAALAWTAIHHDDPAMRSEATAAIPNESEPLVLAVIAQGLRDQRHSVVNAAGALAGAIDAIQTIPLLIFSQYSRDEVQKKGDLAWIAMGTQQSYVQNLIPVGGDNAGAFQPVIGTLTEGFVMRVSDAVAFVYRRDVHSSLIRLSGNASGQSTEHLGWDMHAWREWYNATYLPLANIQREDLANEDAAQNIVERERERLIID